MQGDTYAFIIRIWHEALDSEGNILAWRGSIEQVGANRRLYFQDLDQIRRFIEDRVGLQANDTGPRSSSLLARIKHDRS